MSMPIQRQSEAYSVFDDGPRFARDRSSTDLPKGLAGLVNSMGPRITGGLLNTRQAVNVDHMPPDSHAYHTELPYGPGGDWIGDDDEGYHAPKRLWNPDFGYEPTDEDERRAELVGEDDDSGYNWGPEPHGIPEHLVRGARRGSGRHPFDRTAACQQCGGEVYPERGSGWQHLDPDIIGEDDHFADPDDDDIANDEYGDGLDTARGMDAYKQRREMNGSRTAADAAADPAAMAPQVPAGGGFQPAHRVGLPWRDSVIPGTVIGLDGPSVAVRWDDGQYSTEEPHNIQLL